MSYQTVGNYSMRWTTACSCQPEDTEGSQHADRDEQFEHINRKAQRYLKQGEPVISVDTKKKELVEAISRMQGGEWEQKGQPGGSSRSRLRNPRTR